jgi:hypothetical protein
VVIDSDCSSGLRRWESSDRMREFMARSMAGSSAACCREVGRRLEAARRRCAFGRIIPAGQREPRASDNAPRRGEKRRPEGRARGCLTTPESATNCGRTMGFRWSIRMAWQRLVWGKGRGRERRRRGS